MKVINVVRWSLAIVLALVLFPIAWVCAVLTMIVGLTLVFIEELGIDVGIVGVAFLKIAEKWQELYKGIVRKVAPKNARL